MLGENQPFLERSVYYDGLSAGSIRYLVEKSEFHGMESLLSINKEALELEKKDVLDDNAQHYRMTLESIFIVSRLRLIRCLVIIKIIYKLIECCTEVKAEWISYN